MLNCIGSLSMCEQVFKKDVPVNVLFDLLEKICLKTEKYYFLDQNAFKKLLFHDLYVGFREELRPHYHVSKRFYIDRELTYRMFANVVRQLARTSNVRFDSEIKYHQSKYHVDYMVYHNGETTEQEVSAHREVAARKEALHKAQAEAKAALEAQAATIRAASDALDALDELNP